MFLLDSLNSIKFQLLDDIFAFHENTFYLTVKNSDCGCVCTIVSAMLVMSIRYQHVDILFWGEYFFRSSVKRFKIYS